LGSAGAADQRLNETAAARRLSLRGATGRSNLRRLPAPSVGPEKIDGSTEIKRLRGRLRPVFKPLTAALCSDFQLPVVVQVAILYSLQKRPKTLHQGFKVTKRVDHLAWSWRGGIQQQDPARFAAHQVGSAIVTIDDHAPGTTRTHKFRHKIPSNLQFPDASPKSADLYRGQAVQAN
jgi:hypothetical protein